MHSKAARPSYLLLMALAVAAADCARERHMPNAGSGATATDTSGIDPTRIPLDTNHSDSSATLAAITAVDLQRRVSIFADDSMQGRLAGSAGHARAILYIARELQRLGLKPWGDSNSYFQRVPLADASGSYSWSWNVVALLPGNDSSATGEFVALGAHSDHVGKLPHPIDHDSARAVNGAVWDARRRDPLALELDDDKRRAVSARALAALRATRRAEGVGRTPRLDSIFNGADDDGSGSMALLEVAEFFAAQRARPARSLLFVWHTAEESGLEGSEWFVTHSPVPLERIVAQVNVDMIGRGGARDIQGGSDDYLAVIGAGRLSKTLAMVVEQVNSESARPLKLDYSLDAPGHPESIYCRSDHASYARRGIPIAFLFTNVHQDYHEVTDEARYLDYAHYARVVDFIARLAGRLAEAPSRPALDKPAPDPGALCRQ